MDISDTVEAYVRASLCNETEPLWFPRLAELVTQVAWERLRREIGLNPCSYSTTRLLLRDPRAEHQIAASCKPKLEQDEEESTAFIPVEILAPDVVRQLTDDDVRLLDCHSITETVAHQLGEALSLLNKVPMVWHTVHQLVRALHVIDPIDDEIDVSFSDPSIPFTVFVSVPTVRSEIATLRVAEAILHESMHLNLTLIADIVPLTQPNGEMRYSPWRGEERDSEGILHALYVFSVIRSFFLMLPTLGLDEASHYVSDRTEEIESQIRQFSDFKECDELTPEAAALVARLLNVFE